MKQSTRREFAGLVLGAGVTATVHSRSAVAQTPARSLPDYRGPWTPLFNGHDLEGWTFFQDGVGAVDSTGAVAYSNGVIHLLGPKYSGDRPGFGHIATTKEYGNYHLRLQFRFGDRRFEPRLLAKRNSGILYHMFPQRDRVWPNSVEFQLEESDVGDAILINCRCQPGADLGGTPAWPDNIPAAAPRPVFQENNPRPPIERQRVEKNGDFERRDDWNTIELITYGDKAAQLVNGRIVNTLYDLVGQDFEDRSIYRTLNKGRIGLELEAAEAMFRNVEIRLFA